MRLTGLILFLFILALPASKLSAQSYILINGQVWNLKGEKLVGAHALNYTKKYGTFTDAQGKFFIVLEERDSLKVSMVGYKPYYMQVPVGMSAQSYSLNVTLVADTLILEPAIIRPYPATYREFKQEFLTLRVPEEALANRLLMPTKPFRKNYESPGGGLLLPGPFTLLYNAFSKEAKELRKMQAIMENENLRNALLAIISKEVLLYRYGCKTDYDIDELIFYCGITSDYLASTPHYLIARKVNTCGTMWKNSRK